MKRRTFLSTALVAGLGLAFSAQATTHGDLDITVHTGASLFKMPELTSSPT